MSTISLRLPDSLHESVRDLAKEDNISITLAEKMSALTTEKYLSERAKKGNKKKFKSALSKVKDIEPDARDKL